MIGIKKLLIHSLFFFGSSLSPLIPNLNKLAKYTGSSYKEGNENNSLLNLPTHFGLKIFYDEDSNLILTCRGTSNLSDWIENINCALVKHEGFKNALVHCGYYNTMQKMIAEPGWKFLHEIVCLEKDVYLCGHSSAAAKNILICHYLAQKHSTTNFHIIAFGMPKFADSHFYRELKEFKNVNLISIRLADDIVPTLGIGVHDQKSTLYLDLKNFVLNPFKAHQMIRYREAVLLYKKCNDTINSLYDNFF